MILRHIRYKDIDLQTDYGDDDVEISCTLQAEFNTRLVEFVPVYLCFFNTHHCHCITHLNTYFLYEEAFVHSSNDDDMIGTTDEIKLGMIFPFNEPYDGWKHGGM